MRNAAVLTRNDTDIELVVLEQENANNPGILPTSMINTTDSADMPESSPPENDSEPISPEIDLSPKAVRLLEALLRGESMKDACKAADMSESTGYRIVKEDAFRSRLAKERASLLEGIQTRLLSNADTAISALLGVIESDKATDSAKIKAASEILSYSIKTSSESALDSAQYWLEKISGSEY
jgi:hypothetical protein